MIIVEKRGGPIWCDNSTECKTHWENKIKIDDNFIRLCDDCLKKVLDRLIELRPKLRKDITGPDQ